MTAEPRILARNPDTEFLAAKLEQIEYRLERMEGLLAQLATPENLALLERYTRPLAWKLRHTPKTEPGGKR